MQNELAPERIDEIRSMRAAYVKQYAELPEPARSYWMDRLLQEEYAMGLHNVTGRNQSGNEMAKAATFIVAAAVATTAIFAAKNPSGFVGRPFAKLRQAAFG